MAKGDIVLITFPFTNLTGSKLRPTVVHAETELDCLFYHDTVRMARTNRRSTFTKSSNGLRKQSLIRTSKIATLDKTLAKGLLGRLKQDEVIDLNKKLKTLLQLI